ncbi:FRG domain-containing protein [Nocardioides sp. STR2]|uniref:FRG domain-containing protein n=1 Tax=Nocardioides pini TaxID=2975053 RepID=A0ABT4CAD6_9ACTN|nr:FRG domain-containing protein [Nocardioides pini]MCY4725915.1 FRG domain-containing protein [Nocardioides pini]
MGKNVQPVTGRAKYRAERLQFGSFAELSDRLGGDAEATFRHHWEDPSWSTTLPVAFRPRRWDHPGLSGTSEVPKYLYRGEAGVYPASTPSRARIERQFDGHELSLLDEASNLAVWAWRMRTGDAFRSIGWPQHYGFPTAALDLTDHLSVALHFAADASPGAIPQRVLYRLDLERVVKKVYGRAGAPTPLKAAGIAHENSVRAERQHAWIMTLGAAEKVRLRDLPFDLRGSRHLRRHLERFVIDARDCEAFVDRSLLLASDDAFAWWPLAVLRSLHATLETALPSQVAIWLAGRIPLFEQTPVQMFFDEAGSFAAYRFTSPNEATLMTGLDYAVDLEAVISELTSTTTPDPNGILYGHPVPREPGTQRWLLRGDTYQIQWRYPFPGLQRSHRGYETITVR